ncbi:uncharacterized protein BT62DRAFT_991170 [Guyanagaster necrorhizus]|uniref:RING-type domain-containing protein n=1 Tax=Guyanagaster necrorhizus TaxID=856835 RepID=A0A9P7W2Y6_9AGAR|nr:uncharacterized protein BT62DRAFT_991170 [Guyanagaster necrorhizus MCA 3950]KAG7451682.1 hypothetical protein BT62DRAFT_991170 [Guyanagaster necrorhizus MCA 3950]
MMMPSVASIPGPSSIGTSSARKRSSTESLGVIRPEKRPRTGTAGEKKKRRRKKKKKSIVDNALASTSVKAANTMNVDANAQESSDATLASVSSESDAPKEPAAAPVDMKGKVKAKSLHESPEDTIIRLKEELQAKSQLLKKHNDVLRQVQQTMTCQVCLDLLRKPYALSPCGHVACQDCLLQWFTNPAVDVGALLAHKPKTCPHCRTVITKRPIEIWTIKSTVTGLLKSGLLSDIQDHPQSETTVEGDPWKGTFGTRLQQDDQDLDMLGIFDEEDGVRRCRHCMHEIWAGVCSNCDRFYPGSQDAPRGRDSMPSGLWNPPNFRHHPGNVFGLDVEMSDEEDYDGSFLDGSVGSFIDDDQVIEVHDSDSEGDRRSVSSWREGSYSETHSSPSEVLELSLASSPPRSSVYPSLRNLSPHSSSSSSSHHDTWDATRTNSVNGEDSTFEEEDGGNPRPSVMYRPSIRPIVIDDDDDDDEEVAVLYRSETGGDEDGDIPIPMTYRGRIGNRLRAMSDDEDDDDVHPASAYSNFTDEGYDVYQHLAYDEDGYAEPEDASDGEALGYYADEVYGYSDSDRDYGYDDEDDGSVPGPPSHLRDYLAQSDEEDEDDLYY